MFINLLRYFLAFPVVVLGATLSLFCFFLGFKHATSKFVFKYTSKITLRVLNIKINLIGIDNMIKPAIFVCNHQDLLDIFILQATLPPYKFIAKKEIRRIPIIGWAIALDGILIERKNPKKSLNYIINEIQKLPQDHSIKIYPEGSRNPTDSLKPIKKGVFYIALKTKLPIVPVGLYGIANSPYKKNKQVEVTVGEAIITKHWGKNELIKRILEISDAMSLSFLESKKRFDKL